MYPKELTSQVICRPDYPVVDLQEGKIRGLVVEGTFTFRGIRYAEARRFQMPESVKAWSGIKDARVFGTVSPELYTDIAHDAYHVPHFYYPQDENCQYLNIWTQHLEEDAKAPVMVWIHGGGFETGSGIELFAYDGEELSKFGNVVVVSLNHRLNILGYLDLFEFGEQYRYSGNVGTADIVEALRWIRRNIHAFGGDPDNVTIMGQSGGGGKVACLLQTPAADGLYHRAIIQSGVIPGREDVKPDDARAFTRKVTQELGITKDSIQDIEKVPYYKLARAAIKAARGRRVPVGPVADGEYFLGNALYHGFRKETLSVPVMIGSVLGEFMGNFNFSLQEGDKNDWDEKLVMSLIERVYGSGAADVLKNFKSAYPGRALVDCLFVDSTFRSGSLLYSSARAHLDSSPVYVFLFALECPADGGDVPWHNAEEAYMFHNARYLEASYIPEISERLQDQMTGAWVAFASSGNPNHGGIPHWASLQEESGTTMIFDRQVYSACRHDEKLIDKLVAIRESAQKFFAPVRSAVGGGPRQSI